MRKINLIGKTFGEWDVVSLSEKKSYYNCICSCGKEKEVFSSSLTGRKSLSCGCKRMKHVLHDIPSGFIEYKLSLGMIYVNKLGDVFSVRSGKMLIPSTHKKGYKQITFYDNNNARITRKVHRIVAETFIVNDENKPTVNHIDGNKLNNNVSNLEWATYGENQQHAYDNGLCPKNKRKEYNEL